MGECVSRQSSCMSERPGLYLCILDGVKHAWPAGGIPEADALLS